jgi:phosphatidylglycerophosphate synthase
MRLYQNLADTRRLAKPATRESWTFQRYRFLSIFLSVPLVRLGISANQITIAWILLDILGAVAVGFQNYGVRLFGVCLLQSSELLDFVDGEVARLSEQTSKCGTFLDNVGHDVWRRGLFLAIGYQVFRATHSVAYLLLAFSSAVFVGSYQMAPLLAEYVGIQETAAGSGSPIRRRNTSLARKVVAPLFLLMRNVKMVVCIAVIFNRLPWVLWCYAITSPVLFLWRIFRLSYRLRRDLG